MVQKNKILITTGIQETWDTDSELVFLGEWCKPYHLKKKYETRTHSSIPYHWNDSDKLRQDHDYLGTLNEAVLNELAKSLNEFHKVNYSLRYWRIILGPWLLSYISILWDRWENLRIAFEHTELDSTTIFSLDKSRLVAIDYDDFVNHFQSDIWNHYIFSEILEFKHRDKLSVKEIPYDGLYPTRGKNVQRESLKSKFIYLIDELLGKIQRKYKIVFVSSYFDFSTLLKMSLRLKQLPRLQLRFFKKIQFPDFSLENREFLIDIHANNEFEIFLQRNLIRQIPIVYLEGYKDLDMEISKITCEGDIIFTANAHLRNDNFNAWCAKKVESGTEFVVSQHGGGIKSEMTVFRHQEKIADKMVVWHKPLENCHVRLSPNKLIDLNIDKTAATELTLVGYEAKIYAIRAQSGPMGSGIYHDYQQKLDFAKNLSSVVYKNLRVRSEAHGEGFFNSELRFKEDLGADKLSIHKSLREAFKYSKIVVCTYPQTTLSESMNSGVPTILLYSEHLWPLDPNFNHLIKELKENKILFSCPVEAAKHINDIWSDPEIWWASTEVVQARESFFDMCGRVRSDWLSEWIAFFEDELSLKKKNNRSIEYIK